MYDCGIKKDILTAWNDWRGFRHVRERRQELSEDIDWRNLKMGDLEYYFKRKKELIEKMDAVDSAFRRYIGMLVDIAMELGCTDDLDYDEFKDIVGDTKPVYVYGRHGEYELYFVNGNVIVRVPDKSGRFYVGEFVS